MRDLIERLAEVVHERLLQLKFSKPRRSVLAHLLRIAHLASLKTEEGRFVRGSLTYANPDSPDEYLPFTIRADYPSFTRFGSPSPVSVERVAKLFRAIDKWTGSIAVYGTSARNLSAWGVVDQLVQFNIQVNRESDSGFNPPGIVKIDVDAVGDISVSHHGMFLGGLSQDQLIIRRENPLMSPFLFGKVEPHIRDYATKIAQCIERPDARDEIASSLYEGWGNTVARLCIGLRRIGVGGSLIITPNVEKSELQVGERFDYRRLGDALILSVLDRWHSWNLRGLRDQHIESEAVPWDISLEADLAETDRQDRESEVNGAVKLVSSIATTDGAVLLDPLLRVVGFGAKIRAETPPGVVLNGASYLRRQARAARIDATRFGTRHNSMLRYCRADSDAIGVVVSQDGGVKLIMSRGESLIFWENVNVLDYYDFSKEAARAFVGLRELRRRNPQERTLGYSSAPKTVASLLQGDK